MVVLLRLTEDLGTCIKAALYSGNSSGRWNRPIVLFYVNHQLYVWDYPDRKYWCHICQSSKHEAHCPDIAHITDVY